MTERLRRTKIIATLGPQSQSDDVIAGMLAAGVSAFRLNFSHGDVVSHADSCEKIRRLSKAQQSEVAIIADLQGPKIRIAAFANSAITLSAGDTFILDTAYDSDAGNQSVVGVDYLQLHQDVSVGDKLLLDDGQLVLMVTTVSGTAIHCEVIVGGRLSDHKGINRLGGGLSADALTDKDRNDLLAAAAMDIDYIAVSFPRCAEDINAAKALLQQHDKQAGVIAKIERAEAIDNLDGIIQAADGVMVARGDLGVEIGDSELPGVQKQIIRQAQALDKFVITATQMMESMIDSNTPTRAEVFDVANAVLDGTDAVMLSAETAVGKYPIAVIEAMDRVCRGAEANRIATRSKHRIDSRFETVDQAIALAAMYIANHLEIRAIAALTESGSTALWMSRIRSSIPIFAITRHIKTARRVCLFRGVYPVSFDIASVNEAAINACVIDLLARDQRVIAGDNILVTRGEILGAQGGGTDRLTLVTVN